MLLVEFGKRPYAVRAQELILVQHLGKDPAQPLWVHQGADSTLSHSKMAWTCWVNLLREFGYAAQAFVNLVHRMRDVFPGPLFYHCGGAERQKPNHGAHFKPLGTAIGKPQQVVIEAVF